MTLKGSQSPFSFISIMTMYLYVSFDQFCNFYDDDCDKREDEQLSESALWQIYHYYNSDKRFAYGSIQQIRNWQERTHDDFYKRHPKAVTMTIKELIEKYNILSITKDHILYNINTEKGDWMWHNHELELYKLTQKTKEDLPCKESNKT